MNVRGSCLCGRVRFRISGALFDILNCHCSMCRKYHGAAFKSRARVRAAELKLTAGAQTIRYYESSPGEHKGFCSTCGSPILTRFDRDTANLTIALGTLDDDPGVVPERHIFVGSKAGWHTITDTLPRHQDFE